MKTQTRSRILTIGVAGALLAGASLPLLPFAIAHAQTQASPSTTLLDRGLRLINQHEYQTAKQVLLSIDPSKLDAADQTRLAGLLQKADAGLAAMSVDQTVYHNATASLQDGHLAHAARLFQYIINSPEASAQLKGEAADNLALTQAKQHQLAPQMNSLLQDAMHAYQAGNYDQAEAELYKIQESGVNLGDQADMIPHYQYLIAQQRVQQVHNLEAAQAAKAAAAQKLLAQQKAQANQKLAAEKTAQQMKAQQMAQAAAAAKLAEQQREAQQKLKAQEAAAQKLAEEQKVQQAKAAAAAKLAQEQKLAAEKAAQERKLVEEKAAAQRMAAEKLAAAKLAHEQQLARQKLLAEQMSQEHQAELAREAAAAAAAKQAAAVQAQIAATQKAALEAQQAKAKELAAKKVQAPAPATAKTSAPATPAVATPVASPAVVVVTPPPAKPVPAPMPAPAPVTSAAPQVAKPSLAQIERDRSAALVVQADHDMHNAEYAKAVALYNDALSLDPKNEAAAMGLHNAQKLSMGQAPGLLSQQIYDQAIEAQRAHVLFDNDLRLSTKEMQAARYPQAVDHASDALATIEAARGVLTSGDYKEMKARADQQIAIIQQQEARMVADKQAKQSQEVTESQLAIEHQLEVRRQRQINQLMGQARAYFQQMQYQQALDTLNQVIAIDPQNNTARFMQEMVSDQLQYNAWNKYHTLRSQDSQAQEVKNEEFMIPYPNLEIYPQDWPELSRMREAEQHNSQSSADKAARLALAKNVSKIVVNQQPFSDVINLLRQQTGANIVVNWNALASAGVQKQTPISLTLRGVPFQKVLSLVLLQAQGSGTTQLGYSISDGVISISTNDQLAQQQVTRVFNIQDLLVQAPNFTAPSFNLQNQGSTTGVQVQGGQGGAGGGAGNGNLFTGGGGGANGQQVGKTRKEMVKEITQLIENTVARTSWIDNGGTTGSLREINGQLVITQTPNNLEKVSALLRQLRETRSVEISIDSRFLYVTTGFLNDFGFSWSLGFGPNFFGPDVGGTIGTNTTTGAPQLNGPVTFSNTTSQLTTPQATGIPGGSIATGFSTPSMSMSGSILSNYQLSLLLQATQLNKRNTLLEAPRVTLFNGQRATMIVENVQNYVQSFTQTVGVGGGIVGIGGGGVGTNLNVLPLVTGLSLSVQATVSPDDRYVIMTIQPSLSQLLSLETFSITGANITGLTTPPPGEPAGFVQLPDTQVTEVSTTVSVPDGGTLLLGGERLAGETTIEAGVPVLSQIPFINRLFTNRSTVRDNVVLLILVRPRIILQKEFEKRQFGRNY